MQAPRRAGARAAGARLWSEIRLKPSRHPPFLCPDISRPRLIRRPALPPVQRRIAGNRVVVFLICNRFHDSCIGGSDTRSEEHTSELQSLMRISYAVFCLKKKKTTK